MPAKYLFIDRDGTLIEEPEDEQIDSFEKLALLPDVIPALRELRDAGYRFVMVTNQDGLGSSSFPLEAFEGPQKLLLQILASQGIEFEAVLVDPSRPEDNSPRRKPGVGMVLPYLKAGVMDTERSYVIGDRESDGELATNMGIQSLRVGDGGLAWKRIPELILGRPRHAIEKRETRETRVRAEVDLDLSERPEVSTGLGFFDHMLEQLGAHGGFMLRLDVEGDLHVDAHHTIEDAALVLGAALDRALGDRRGIGRYGFVLPMDETRAEAAVDLSGRPYAVFEGEFDAPMLGELPTEMVPHFFRSLAQTLRAAIHITVRGENTHHKVEASFKVLGRALRQAIRREEQELPSTKGVL